MSPEQPLLRLVEMMSDEKMKPNCKVKRLKAACCGMENDKVYDAYMLGESYAYVLLPSGEWTSSHWAPGYFEVLTPTTKHKAEIGD